MKRVLLAVILIAFGATAVVAADYGLEKDLSRDLAQTRPLIAKIKAGRQTKTDMERLKGLAENIKAAHLLLDERFKQREQEPGVQGPKAKERHLRMRQKYRQAMDEYVTLLEGVAQGRDLQAATLDRLLVLLNKLLPKKKRPIYGSLPYRHLRYAAKAPLLTPVITPAYQGGDKTVVAADTAATPEAPISEEIAALAKSLNWSPVAIYEWVKNNVETEWYWGCMKGAEETLRQKSGNDADQATLLVALLRAAGYPCRYVRGVIEFFPDIEVAKNLTGIADEQELAAFFQKTGIPYKQVVAGGRIANLQIEHVWVESYIPYANYRGVVIDDQGKTWLGLDTAIKAAGYTYNTPKSIPSDVSLPGVREDYLAAVQTELPLEYLQAQIQAVLPAGSTYEDLLGKQQLIPEEMRILPASLQFKEIAITAEYAAMPQELTHQARFKAIAPDNSELFNVTLPAFTLTSRPIVFTYEPETVEDQEIINSYGGLGNTPSYLIRLRPVLLVDGERMAIGTDGFASGTEYTLVLDLISPSGTEKITNTLIIGNLSVMGFVAQKPGGMGEGEKDAQQLLYEQAISYIERWNQAEAELASLLGLTLSRPLPTVVTLGGVVEITSLLDTPQGFEWKGVYVDANLRAVEAGDRSQQTGDRIKTFMQLASLQGSILENRIFEDGFQVESVSTAKLFGLAKLAGVPIVAIDKTNIATMLPGLSVGDNIKEAIQNAVNQNLTIHIPKSEITYEDWTGTGYLAENPATGEAGWMLTGEIAGGMTVWNPERWPVEVRETLENPYAVPPNKNPLAASTIEKINATDRQTGIVGQALKDTLRVLVLDKDKKPVQGAQVIFTIKAGEGKLRTVTKPGEQPQEGGTLTVQTDHGGVARIQLILGEKTSANPTMWWKEGYTYSQQVGENIVNASLASGTALAVPFTAYGFPDETTATMRMLHGDGTTVDILSFAGFISVIVEDKYANPISNYPIEFTAQDVSPYCVPAGEKRLSALLVPVGDPCITAFPTYGTCSTSPNAGKTLTAITNYRDAAVQIFTGAVPGAAYPITAFCSKIQDAAKNTVTFTLHTNAFGNCDGGSAPSSKFFVGYVYAADQYGHNIDAGAVGKAIPLEARIYFLREGEEKKTITITCDSNTAECEKTVGSKVYSEDTNFETASVTFGGQPGTTEGNGVFTGQYQLQAGVNNIAIQGTAKAVTPKHWTSTGCDGSTIICSPVTEEVKGDITTTMQVYGVALTVPQKLLVMVDQEGYTVSDIPITYTIVPSEYKAATAYVAIMKKDASGTSQPLLYIPGKTQGTDTVTLSRGFWFDINGAYEAQMVLNYGTGVEIRSDKIQLNIMLFPIRITDVKTPCEESPDPYPHTCVDSFIFKRDESGDKITVTGEAKQEGLDISSQINWTCSDAPGDGIDSGECNPSTSTDPGATFTFTPKPQSDPDGREYPLAYLVKASITINSETYEVSKVIEQDKLDELRQEYEDLPERESQLRTKFDKDEPVYWGLLGPKAEPNRHRWHILRTLNEHAKATKTNYSSLNITSGYRCPKGNETLRPDSSPKSNHQYGRALDFQQRASSDNLTSLENYEAYKAALNAEAADDTYLTGANNVRYYYDNRNQKGYPTWPAPDGTTYIKGHAAW